MKKKVLKKRLSKRALSLCVSLSALILLGAWSTAQEADVLSEKDLKARLSGLEEEYKTEKSALNRLKTVWSKELEERRKTRGQAASTLLNLQLTREALIAQKAELEKQRRVQSEQSAKTLKILDSVLDSAEAHGEQLNFYLQELPGTEKTMDRVEKILAAMKNEDKKDKRDQIEALLQIFDTAHSRACKIEVRKERLFTANGVEEEVELLSIGSVSFAYKSLDGSRMGLALGSPEEASGYRWVEQLTPELRSQFNAVFAKLKNPQGPIAIPLDVSRRLRINALLDKKDIVSQLEAGGWVMVPLTLIAILAFLLIVERQFVFLLQGTSSKTIQEAFKLCETGDFEKAKQMLADSKGLVARVLSACLERRIGGQEAMENAIQERLLYELPKLQKRLGGISVLGAIAPLLGLLGTVTGIIQTFGVIKVFGNANPGLMAGGISEALITTATGLVIAIPILLLHSALNGRMDRLISDAEKYAATLLNILARDSGAAADESVANEQVSARPAPKAETPAPAKTTVVKPAPAAPVIAEPLVEARKKAASPAQKATPKAAPEVDPEVKSELLTNSESAELVEESV
ncbi:MAG: MotA/TolQ/ExbB proton channel family protein [Planctomycetota bacterium]|nr:MotA/TolQ/ExbB proton channel family protein [Planctomycetota bacterium]